MRRTRRIIQIYYFICWESVEIVWDYETKHTKAHKFQTIEKERNLCHGFNYILKQSELLRVVIYRAAKNSLIVQKSSFMYTFRDSKTFHELNNKAIFRDSRNSYFLLNIFFYRTDGYKNILRIHRYIEIKQPPKIQVFLAKFYFIFLLTGNSFWSNKTSPVLMVKAQKWQDMSLFNFHRTFGSTIFHRNLIWFDDVNYCEALSS